MICVSSTVKNDKVETTYRTFTGSISNLRIDLAKNTIKESNRSENSYKYLLYNILEHSKTDNTQEQKNQLADIIERWSCNIRNCPWHTELITFCKEKNNIHSAYAVSNKNREEFIIVMDDSTDESVLDYNEFGFNLREKFNTIHDFMVLDVGMLSSINSMFEKIEKIYERRI